jgi:hypothetical protein
MLTGGILFNDPAPHPAVLRRRTGNALFVPRPVGVIQTHPRPTDKMHAGRSLGPLPRNKTPPKSRALEEKFKKRHINQFGIPALR